MDGGERGQDGEKVSAQRIGIVGTEKTSSSPMSCTYETEEKYAPTPEGPQITTGRGGGVVSAMADWLLGRGSGRCNITSKVKAR